MKIVKIWGGIGNQLFQYYFGQYLYYEFNYPIAYVNKFGFLEAPYKLSSFLELNFDQTINEAVIHKFPSYFNQFYRINRKLLQVFPIISKKILVEVQSNNIKEELHQPDLFDGYWQDIDFLECLKSKNNFHFSFSNIENFKKNKYHQLILNETNSVAVHIRRGDYLTSNYHINLGLDYYRLSMEIISRKIANPVFFIFSDDMLWVKENFSSSSNTIFVDNESLLNSDIQDFYLMTLCKHHIIANSTFSWWPAYLNNHPSSITIAPQEWYKKNNGSSKKILKSEWILQ